MSAHSAPPPPAPVTTGTARTASTHLRFSKTLLGQEAHASGGDQSLAVALRGPRASAIGSLRPRPSNKDLGLGVHLQGGSGRNHSGVGKRAGADKGCVGYQALGCPVNRPRAPPGVRQRGARPPRPFLAQRCLPAPLLGGNVGWPERASECGGHVCGRRRFQRLQDVCPTFLTVRLEPWDGRDLDGGWRQSEDSGVGMWSSGVMVTVRT